MASTFIRVEVPADMRSAAAERAAALPIYARS